MKKTRALSVDKKGPSKEVLGQWMEDRDALPAYNYTGSLPWTARRPDGDPAHLHEDPYFLLGNHRCALMAHVSGAYRFFSTQRGFAMVNMETPGSGASGAVLRVGRGAGEAVALTGLQGRAADPASCRRIFGCGFAEWRWSDVQGVRVSRLISMRPSRTPGEGPAVAVIDVTLENLTAAPLACDYREWLVVRYATTYHLNKPGREDVIRYRARTEKSIEGLLLTHLSAVSSDPSINEDRGQPCRYDLYPPTVFFGIPGLQAGRVLARKAAPGGGELLEAGLSAVLAPGEMRRVRFVVGFVHVPELEALPATLSEFLEAAPSESMDDVPGGIWGAEWGTQIPAFADERDATLRREMRWHAAMLLSLVRYHELYDGVYLPQSGSYDYLIGFCSVPRDFAQHLLPLCRLAPAFARSAVLVQFRRMQADGAWAWSEVGAGWQTDFQWTSSDLQLYAMLALTEYLDTTGDLEIFQAPAGGAPQRDEPLFERLVAAFRYLRDEVSTGSHGLVRMLGGDWNDSVTYERPLGQVYWGGESHLNTAMALEIFRRLPRQLERWSTHGAAPGQAGRARQLAAGMKLFRTKQRAALLKDWGDRPFPARFHVNDHEAVGREHLYLEHLGFLMRQPDLPRPRRLRLLREIERRLGRGEPLGFRSRETVDSHKGSFSKPGCQENGGVWWALMGGTIWGAAHLDPKWARRVLGRSSLAGFARTYPDYWLGHWTSMDCFNSSVSAAPGLGYDSGDFGRCGGFTTHVHAWLLFCYQNLRAGR